MKAMRKGSFVCVFLNIVIFWTSFSLLKQYVGFPFMMQDIRAMNSLMDFLVLAAVFFLFCVANWSITSLMNGEGRFKDIVFTAGYAMTPLNLFFIPATLLSRVLVDQEAAFYLIFIYAGIIWFLFLLFTGILTVHNYTLMKTVLTILMTVVSAFIILFLALLFVTVLSQIAGVLNSVYVEISYRM